MKTHVVTHANCPDGFGAAFAAHKRFGDDVEYTFARHGKDGNHDLPVNYEGADVYILDFSYPEQVLWDIASKARRVRLFDHHATALEDLRHLVDEDDIGGYEGVHKNLELYFDMSRSGAGGAHQGRRRLDHGR